MGRANGTHADAIVSTVTVDLTERERAWVDRMRAAIHVTSDANLVRIALWRLARHVELKPDADIFACRVGGEGAARAKRRRRDLVADVG